MDAILDWYSQLLERLKRSSEQSSNWWLVSIQVEYMRNLLLYISNGPISMIFKKEIMLNTVYFDIL